MEIWLSRFRWIWLCVSSSSKDGVLAVRVVVVVEIVDLVMYTIAFLCVEYLPCYFFYIYILQTKLTNQY